MIKKYCINCHTLYDTGEEDCPNCGFKVTDVKFVMQDGEVLTVNEYAMRKDATNLSRCDLQKKEIEEMAQIMEECCNLFDEKGIHIRNKCNPYDCEFYCETNDICCSFGMKQATALYNAGYRKVNEDEVVLSISEVEEFRKDEAEVKFLKKQIQEEARKETAREILHEILYVPSVEGWEENEQLVEFSNRIAEKIIELAEKFGVEVE